MFKPSQRGEIATLLTIGAVIFLGISTLVSSTLLKNTQTTKSKASTGTCRDNPEAPPAGYTWKADCARACSSNSDCPKNTSSGYVDPNSSSWCYGFESGFRCLQLQYGGGGTSTGSQPGGTTSQPSGSGTNNGCFTLAAEFEPRNEGENWAFYAWVRFSGPKTGDVQLMYNGTHVAGWNRKPGPDDFVYDPSWTQSWAIGNYTAVATLASGGSTTVSYQGFLSGCTPQDITVSCTLSAGATGVSVSGTGCVCRGCSSSGSTNTTQPTAPPVSVPTTSTNNPTIPSPTPTVYTSNICSYDGMCASLGFSTCGGTCSGSYCCKSGQVTPVPTVVLENCTMTEAICRAQQCSCTLCNNGKYKCAVSFAASTSTPAPTLTSGIVNPNVTIPIRPSDTPTPSPMRIINPNVTIPNRPPETPTPALLTEIEVLVPDNTLLVQNGTGRRIKIKSISIGDDYFPIEQDLEDRQVISQKHTCGLAQYWFESVESVFIAYYLYKPNSNELESPNIVTFIEGTAKCNGRGIIVIP